MKISDIRRERLKQWFAGKTLPAKDKSYLSQLMGGKSSFGEKAARRLEKDYGMGVGYLDQPLAQDASETESFFSSSPRRSRYETASPRYQKAADKLLELPEQALNHLEPILDDLSRLYADKD